MQNLKIKRDLPCKLNCNSISHRITEGLNEIALAAHAHQFLKLNFSMTTIIKKVQIQYICIIAG